MSTEPRLSATPHRYHDMVQLVEDYHRRGWTDGLPIMPPTPDAVEMFLAHAGLPPDEIIGSVASWSATVRAEHVAINSVMAGCLPEYLPVVVAAVRALTSPAANCWTNCADRTRSCIERRGASGLADFCR